MMRFLKFLFILLINLPIYGQTWTDGGNYNTSWYNDMATSFAISTPEDFAGFIFLANNNTSFDGKVINLISDIDMGEYEWTCCNTFSGELNGNGYCISNIHYTAHPNILDKESYLTGVFKNIEANGLICNINFKNLSINLLTDYGDSFSGGIASYNYGVIRDCAVISNVSVKYSGSSGLGFEYCAGGIAAHNLGTILSCSHTGIVESLPCISAKFAKAYCGGIAAKNSGLIANCVNYGTIISSVGYSGDWKPHTVSYGWSGGICGINLSDTKINNVVNYANVKSSLYLLTSFTGKYCHADGICPQGECANAYYSSSIEIDAPDITKNGTMLTVEQLRNETYDFTSLLNSNLVTIDAQPVSGWGNALSYNLNEPFILNNVSLKLTGAATSQNSLYLECKPIDIKSNIIKEKGFEYSANDEAVRHLLTTEGDFIYELKGLKPSTIYNVRAYIKTPTSVIYSTPRQLTTTSLSVETLKASDITPVSARLNGRKSVGNTPILSQGFIWKVEGNDTYNVNYTEGVDFSYTINNLQPATTVFYQAFVVTQDNENIYGDELNFTTLPIAVTLNCSNAAPNRICLYGRINIPIKTDVIVEFRKLGESYFSSKTVSSDSEGCFDVDLDNIESNTTYEIRAHINYNNIGISSPLIEVNSTLVNITTLPPDISESVTFYGKANGDIAAGDVGFEYRDTRFPDIVQSSIIIGIKNGNDFYASTTNVTNGTPYKVRAYYKDIHNSISYGDWIEFTPINVSNSGIENVFIEDIDKISIFDIFGNKLDAPTHGINILVYPSGLKKKILFK